MTGGIHHPATDGGTRVVPAAGGVLRRSSGRVTEVLLVHRPRYDDWTLPKGKLEPGEHPLLAAVREVSEETGVVGVPLRRLPGTRYLTGRPGVEKSVEYWLMRVGRDLGRDPDDEVDALAWLPYREAVARLTYRHDRGVLAAVDPARPVTAVVAATGPGFLAHGPTAVRLLRLFDPRRVVIAPGTSEPAHPDGLVIEKGEWDSTDPRGIATAFRAMAATGPSTVVCIDPDVLSATIAALRPGNGTATSGYRVGADACWILSFTGTDLVAAEPLTATG